MKLTKPSLQQKKKLKETEGKGFDTERDAAQSALDELKKLKNQVTLTT